MDNEGKIHYCIIRDCLILLAETMMIRQAIRMTIKMPLPNSIIESDSHKAIQSITGKMKPPIQITNFIKDIITLANAIRNIQFFFQQNSKQVEDSIEKAHTLSSPNVATLH